jgi:hypothetical protein
LLKINTIKGQQASNGDTTRKENNMLNLMGMTGTDVAAHMQVMLVADQNDLFRKALTDPAAMSAITVNKEEIKGQILITQGIAGEDWAFIAKVKDAVATFNTFTEDNDPYGDHTFGAFEIDGEKLFWKIDLYDENYEYGSEDPSNLEVTRRALTIMLASEY